MPSIPETWRNDFQVNQNPNGSQVDPVVTVLASGHILVVWTDFDNSSGPGSPAGGDVIGRIFDSLGNAVTNEFRLNTLNTANDEQNPSITALADGGFAVVYDRVGGFDDLFLQTWSFDPATGGVAQENSRFLFLDSGTSNPVNSVIASSSAASVMTAYHVVNADGSDDIFIRHYNPLTDTFQAPVQLLFGSTGAGEDASGPDIAVLNNGNYVVTFVNKNAADDSLLFRIFDAAGGPGPSGTVDSAGEGPAGCGADRRRLCRDLDRRNQYLHARL
jgi:hypothetical protein